MRKEKNPKDDGSLEKHTLRASLVGAQAPALAKRVCRGIGSYRILSKLSAQDFVEVERCPWAGLSSSSMVPLSWQRQLERYVAGAGTTCWGVSAGVLSRSETRFVAGKAECKERVAVISSIQRYIQLFVF